MHDFNTVAVGDGMIRVLAARNYVPIDLDRNAPFRQILAVKKLSDGAGGFEFKPVAVQLHFHAVYSRMTSASCNAARKVFR